MNRVDVELVARGLATSRSAAQRLIADGAVFLATDTPVTKPSLQVLPSETLWVRSSVETRYVSRAGAKLEQALMRTGVEPAGRIALDLGMSTGGFADCLLQAGAVRVVGIEVGHGQLHPRLRTDPRIRCHERINARDLTPAMLADDIPTGGFGLAVADLSFISLTRVLPALDAMLARGGDMLLLVKPQFELTPSHIDRRGVVKDPGARQQALASVIDACIAIGWTVRASFDSDVPGVDGNREFFIHAHKT